MKVGEVLRWAKKNLPKEQYNAIVKAQQGDPVIFNQIIEELKNMMGGNATKEQPKTKKKTKAKQESERKTFSDYESAYAETRKAILDDLNEQYVIRKVDEKVTSLEAELVAVRNATVESRNNQISIKTNKFKYSELKALKLRDAKESIKVNAKAIREINGLMQCLSDEECLGLQSEKEQLEKDLIQAKKIITHYDGYLSKLGRGTKNFFSAFVLGSTPSVTEMEKIYSRRG